MHIYGSNCLPVVYSKVIIIPTKLIVHFCSLYDSLLMEKKIPVLHVFSNQRLIKVWPSHTMECCPKKDISSFCCFSGLNFIGILITVQNLSRNEISRNLSKNFYQSKNLTLNLLLNTVLRSMNFNSLTTESHKLFS